MRRSLLPALALSLTASVAQAGTATDPNVLDVYGDAHVAGPSGQPVNVGWADIGRVWFTIVRDAADQYIGFDVHVVLLNSAEDPAKDARITVEWRTSLVPLFGCSSTLDVWRTDAGESVLPEPGATLYADCGADPTTPVLTTAFTETFTEFGWDLVVPVRLADMADASVQYAHSTNFTLLPEGARTTVPLPDEVPGGPAYLIPIDAAGECDDPHHDAVLPNCVRENEPLLLG